MSIQITGVLAALLAVVATGCGGASGPATSPDAPARQGVGPHGGVAVALGDAGFAELVVEPGPSDSVLAAYFLQPDRTTPLAARPTSVVVEADAGSGPASLPLQPKTGTSPDNRFEADAPAGLDDRFNGKLTVVLDGQTHVVPIAPF